MRIHKGDIVMHFKRETLPVKKIEDYDYLYMYKVLDFAKHTETGELLVIYEALYDGQPIGCDVHCGDKFARPFDMFMSEVDHVKYPNIKQKYRFEVIGQPTIEPLKLNRLYALGILADIMVQANYMITLEDGSQKLCVDTAIIDKIIDDLKVGID